MPIEIFNELKKKYVTQKKIRIKKKTETIGPEQKVESRYMEWQKKHRQILKEKQK